MIGIMDLQVSNMLKTGNLLKQLVKYAGYNLRIYWNKRRNGTGRKL
ncbi:Transposase, IS605 OrfB [Bacillus thuringiensis serovar pondicheriensis BGSC 4BA1]|nr:Transposase, IS605 OrfB [Bacillus thuringiensis serovar pondicheriensis BGSC 4BA1]